MGQTLLYGNVFYFCFMVTLTFALLTLKTKGFFHSIIKGSHPLKFEDCGSNGTHVIEWNKFLKFVSLQLLTLWPKKQKDLLLIMPNHVMFKSHGCCFIHKFLIENHFKTVSSVDLKTIGFIFSSCPRFWMQLFMSYRSELIQA